MSRGGKKTIKKAKRAIKTPPEIKIPEYPICPISKPPNKEPNAVPRGENIVSKTAAPRGEEEKVFETNPDLEELERKLPSSPISIKTRIPINPTIDAVKPIAMDSIANTAPPIKIVFTTFVLERIRIPYKEIGRKRSENNDVYVNISIFSQPIFLRNIRKKD